MGGRKGCKGLGEEVIAWLIWTLTVNLISRIGVVQSLFLRSTTTRELHQLCMQLWVLGGLPTIMRAHNHSAQHR